ncbi:response regulator [bacterium]|nr:MAG: response regulator [bacterium]
MTTKRIKILVVDDEENIRHLLRLAFEDDFDVREARDGEDALKEALVWKPDLIISDIMMPKLDGYGLYRKLKGRPETASVPFVFLSAKKDVEERVVGLEMGADDYITKPFSIKELKAKIRSIIKKANDLKVRGSLEGLLSEVELIEIIQLLEMGRKTGMLILETPENTGNIYFVDGQPQFARTDPWSGNDAFFTMLSWKEGRFRLDPAVQEVEENIDGHRGQELLMEGVRLVDEMKEAIRRLRPKETVFQRAENGDVLEEDMEQVCKAFEGGSTVDEAFSRTRLPVFHFYPMVRNAVSAGHLQVVDTVPSESKEQIEVLRRLKAALLEL